MYRQMMANITAGIQNQPIGDSDIPAEILSEVSDLVERIERWLTDMPYDRLVDQITRRDGVIDDHFADGEPISVIPGNRILACTRVMLAVSIGTSSANSLGFPGVMRSVREHLIECENVAKVVVLLTDNWIPRMNTEHIRDVVAHARRGRYVIPHLISGKRILRASWC
jgi:hypothetical protein